MVGEWVVETATKNAGAEEDDPESDSKVKILKDEEADIFVEVNQDVIVLKSERGEIPK